MQNTKYNIVLRTPIGIRQGTMDVHIHGRIASGMMHLLNRSEPFLGCIEENGECKFTGRLVTRMRTIPYQAMGRITRDNVELSLVGEKESFQLTGRPCE